MEPPKSVTRGRFRRPDSHFVRRDGWYPRQVAPCHANSHVLAVNAPLTRLAATCRTGSAGLASGTNRGRKGAVMDHKAGMSRRTAWVLTIIGCVLLLATGIFYAVTDADAATPGGSRSRSVQVVAQHL